MFHIPIARSRLVFMGIHSLRDALHDLFAGLMALIIMGLGSVTAITLTGSWKSIVINWWRKTIRAVNVVVIGLPGRLSGQRAVYLHYVIGGLGIDQDLRVDPLAGSTVYGVVIDSGRDEWNSGRHMNIAYVHLRRAPTFPIISLRPRFPHHAGIANTA